MRRSFSKTTLGGNDVRVTVRYESEYCEPGTPEARREQMRLLRTLADSTELQICGFHPFQKMTMKHNGTVWLMELEATGPE